MRARPGLIGEAQGGSLFLDEIGELPAELQAHLLRVLDAGGEYHRLGEATARRADVRLIAATNRPPWHLKQDFAARFPLRSNLPTLHDRREDIPLLVRHLILQAAERTPEIARRFVELPSGDHPAAPRIQPEFVASLLRHTYTVQVRELEELLWKSIATSRMNYLEAVDIGPPVSKSATQPTTPREPRSEATSEEIKASLERNQGNLKRTWIELGLSSRFVLYRLMKRYGLAITDDAGDEG
jgi:two-component system nitrogen regulation response regulator GlnG/two-component system response regulator HydG